MDDERISRLFGLHGRVAIVTGGTRGIGLAIAEGFVDAGASVVVASRKADAVERAVARLRERGGNAIGVTAHMGDLDDVQRIVDETVAAFGRIDVVVNNAATALTLPIGSFTADAWAKVNDVNLRGPVFLVQAALPHLLVSPHASVINVISAGAYLPSTGTAMYAAAKLALLSYTRTTAAEFATRGIRVNAIAPGTVETDMVTNNTPEAQDRMAQASFMRRMASPEEMVGPALFLASDASSFVTGQCVIADGGLVPAR
ncbi:MAG: short-chain dehydrogenase/reductase [Ilumatobacteraceae bacterium]|nr:short-chain dehydrogenase/reductase [Ilumatobacteraceae bacterium]MCU1390214.1 short-chain dehydrogenase/reductase [Ilumatobacteraceae bacterium]